MTDPLLTREIAAPDMEWIRQFLADSLNTDFLSPYQREITGEVPESVLRWVDVPFDWADE